MEILIAIITGLLGMLLYEKSKRKTSEASLDNLETKKEILKVEKTEAKNSGLIEAEEEKREQIKKEKKNVSLEEIARYINNRNDNK